MIVVAKSIMTLTLSVHFLDSKRENRLRHHYEWEDEPMNMIISNHSSLHNFRDGIHCYSSRNSKKKMS